MYQLIVFIHILGAVTWVGGGVYSVLVSHWGLTSGDNEETVGFLMDSVQWAGSRIFVLAAATAIVGAVVHERASKELRRVLDESGRSSAEFGAAFRRMTRVSFVDLALVFAILGLMVFKPVA